MGISAMLLRVGGIAVRKLLGVLTMQFGKNT